eukprot:13448875-Heterocapsa_arctica.AAC.1
MSSILNCSSSTCRYSARSGGTGGRGRGGGRRRRRGRTARPSSRGDNVLLDVREVAPYVLIVGG